MTNDPSRARWLALLRWALLAVAVLASAAVATVVGFAAYLFSQGYSGGGDPQSVAPLAFPLSVLVLVVAGLPASLVCAAGWIGYAAVARKSRKPSESLVIIAASHRACHRRHRQLARLIGMT